MEVTIYVILIWVTAFLIASLDITMLLGSENRPSRIFTLLSFITAVWVASQGFLIASSSVQFSDAIIRVQYLLGMLITLGFYYFSHIYPSENKFTNRSFIIPSFIFGFFVILYFFTDLMIVGVSEIGGNGRWAWENGPLNGLYIITFCIYWSFTLYRLYKNSLVCTGKLQVNVKNVFWALGLGIIPPVIFNIILPYAGYYELNWLGPITSIIWILIIFYSIAKHHLFETKVIAVQMVTFALWIFVFIRTILAADMRDFIVQGTLLSVTLVFGILLIKGVLHEISQRENIEKLANEIRSAYARVRSVNDNLERIVHEQTKELRHAYETEKRAKNELQKLIEVKSKFITSTQHNLRTPLTSLKWELESIKKEVGSERNMIQSLKNADLAVSNLHEIIENFIQVTEK